MRVAGRLTADVLDMIGPHVQPGITTAGARPDLPRLHRQRAAGHSRPAQLPGFPKVDLHLGQSRRLPRHPGRPQAQAGGHRQCRHHRHQGRLPRRQQPHVRRRQAHACRAARVMQVSLDAMWRGHQDGPSGQRLGDIGHAVQSYTEDHGCSIVREYCGHGIGRIFHEDPQVLHYGRRAPARTARRHDVHDRADGECRRASRAIAAGRLDRRHEGPLALGAMGAHGAGHRGRLRSADARAQRIAR